VTEINVVKSARVPTGRELVTEWIEELRSGRWQQGRSYLAAYDDDRAAWRFCCLGVLCEIMVRRGLITSQEHEFELARDLVRSYGVHDGKDLIGHDDLRGRDVTNSVLPRRALELLNDGTLARELTEEGIYGSSWNTPPGRPPRSDDGNTEPGEPEAFTLVDLNDEAEYDFTQIADVVQRTYLEPAAKETQ